MTDKQKMPADGGGIAKGKPDGVSGSPDSGEPGLSHGRSPGGESGGGAYPNPHSDKGEGGASFSGGQGDKAYYGGDNPNAPNRSPITREDEEAGAGGPPSVEPHPVELGGRTIEVIEESGVATAEATGKIGTDAPYEEEQELPAPVEAECCGRDL